MPKPLALCIAGTEDWFATEIDDFNTVIAPQCEAVTTLKNPWGWQISRALIQTLKQAKPRQVVLIAYSGHGNILGWHTRNGPYFYLRLLEICCLRFPKVPICFVNGTCYSHHLMKALIGKRSATNTSFLSHWEGYGISYDATMRTLIQAWGNGTLPEQWWGMDIFSSEKTGDVEFSPIQRWGASYDKLFFAPSVETKVAA